MKRLKELVLLIIIGLVLVPNTFVWGQVVASDQAYKNKLKSILSNYKNYRFSNISIYELDARSIGDLKKYDNAKQGAALGGGAEGFDEKSIKDKLAANQDLTDADGHYGDKLYDYVKDQARAQIPLNDIRADLALNKGWSEPDLADLNMIYTNWKNADANRKKLEHVYVLTPRLDNSNIDSTLSTPIPGYIVAAMFVYSKDESVNALQDVTIKDIHTEPELNLVLAENYATTLKDTTLYDHIYKFFLQGNVKDVTLEAQGIGTTITYVAPRAGQVSNIETSIPYLDLQSMLRISDGQPLEMKNKKNEVIIASDMISWKRYDYVKFDESTAIAIKEREEGLDIASQMLKNAKSKLAKDPNNKKLQRSADAAKEEYDMIVNDMETSQTVHNIAPPVIGLELLYGTENLGYPSLWSGRTTTRFVWNGVKLGLILPTSGWSAVGDDLFGQERTLTNTDGAGIAAAFDFAVPVIPESGIFQFTGNAIFGDASPAKFNEDVRSNFLDDFSSETMDPVSDYIVRYDAQLLYTFAMAIDEKVKLRFGLGATIYGAEEWGYTVAADDFGLRQTTMEERGSETVGNITIKASFMMTDVTTPWGATIQYFDNGLFGDIWMQVPVVENMFSIRLDAKGFVKAFGDPRPWEQESVFVPSVRLIMFF